MPSSEFTAWIAYYNLEPFGQDRDNIHTGIIASVIANVFGRKGRKITPDDFMLYDKERKRQSETKGFVAGLRALAKPKHR